MAQEPAKPSPGFSPVHFPHGFELPPRPTSGPPALQDAHRQTQFLLGRDLQLLERLLTLHLATARQASRSKEPSARGILALWARVYGYLADAVSLLLQAGYASATPLVVTACECLAAQRRLIADPAVYTDWLPGSVAQASEHAALSIARADPGPAANLGPLDEIYRLVRLLASSDLGSTLLLTGSESGAQRLSLSFGEGLFHLGWAELVSGWLLRLAGEQLSLAAEFFPLDDGVRAQVADSTTAVDASLAAPNRCHAEDVDGRFLLHNFRRGPANTPRRLLL